MSVQVLTLTTSWQLALSGPGIVQIPDELEGADPEVYSELASAPEDRKIFAAVDTTTPTDDFASLECTDTIKFNLTANLYLRVARGTRVVKVLAFS